MKKIFITSIIALALILGSAAVADAAFTTYLTVGSRGADVTALQTWLIANGYDISAITTGAAAKGYFGQQTKAAVVKYQAFVGLPATGFVGPLTIAKLNGNVTGSVTMTPVSCPAGYTCTPTAGTPVVIANPGMITTPGVAGTLAVSLEGSPSGASLDKGESEDVVRYKLQASASDMQVSSLAIDFDVRFWLYASSVTIKDGNGAVITTKNNLSASDFTELTVGSDYRLYVPLSYVVPRTQTRYLTVSVTMLPVTDRTSATLTINDAQVRSVDGTGVTDTQSVTDDRTFSYTGTNSGSIIASINAASPLKRLVQISNSTETKDVVIAKYDLKSQNRDASLRTLKIGVRTDGTSVNTLFGRVKLQVDGQTYTGSADTSTGTNTTSSSTVTFSDLRIPLSKDVAKTITILVDVAQPSSNGALDGKMASTTIFATTANIAAEDNTYNTVSINAATLTGSDAIFSASGAILSGMAASLGSPITSNNVTVAQPVTFVATLAAGDNALYVSENPSVALSTSSTGYILAASPVASTTLTDVTASPSEIAGDTWNATGYGYFVIPAGSSRTFTWTGTIKNEPASGVVQRTFSVTAVKYGTSSASLDASSINYNLGSLKVTPVI